MPPNCAIVFNPTTMNISDLANQRGEWLRGDGPLSEVVVSSRIRLARNLTGHLFCSRADEAERREVYRKLTEQIVNLPNGDDFQIIDVEETPRLDRQVLVERHLISKQHADGEGSRGVAVSGGERMALMINEEDHLRIQGLRSGLQLSALWDDINDLDDALSAGVEYAFHSQYGYLTACPTNVGTGIRVSVMVHLPALKLTQELERVFRAARDMRLAVRGLYGEGTEAYGDFYQMSNQMTLGRSELELIDSFGKEIIPKIVEYEMAAREMLARERAQLLDDKVWRAFGTLGSARAMSGEESLFLLSHIRMGVQMGRFTELDLATVNDLLIKTLPAHLQKIHGMELDGDQRSVMRAEYLRGRLSSNN